MKLVEDKGVITRKSYEALSEEEKLKYWQIDRNQFKLMSELETEHLQNAFYYAQSKELDFHNKQNLFFDLAQAIEAEAVSRGVVLSDLNTDFHRKKRILSHT